MDANKNNGTERFIAFVMDAASLTRAQAEKVLARYKKERIGKFNSFSGSFEIKHGAFLDADVLRRAAE